MDWNTDTKGIARTLALQPTLLAYKNLRKPGRHRFARTALSLPGNKMLCIREGRKTGIYRNSTYHVFVEREPETQKAISRRMHCLGSVWEPYFHREDLCCLNLSRALLGDTLDWAYLDLCGTLNTRIGWWLQHVLAPNMSYGGGMAFTITRNWRTSKLMLAAVELLRNTETGRGLVNQMHDQVLAARYVGNSSQCYLMLSDDYSDSRFGYAGGSWGHYRQQRFYGSHRLAPVFHESSVEIIATLQLLMPGCKFTVDGCIEYQRDANARCHHMTMLRLINVRSQHPSPGLRKLSNQLAECLVSPQELVHAGD